MPELQAKPTLYGTVWCGDTQRARRILERNQIAYLWVDIDKDPDAARYVERINRGFRSVPTIVWPDGSMLVEPSDRELEDKLIIEGMKEERR